MAANMGKNAKWSGDEYAKRMKQQWSRNVVMASLFLANDIKQRFPKSGAAGTRSGGGSAGNPSDDGGIPHVQAGTLERSISHQKSGDTKAIVGSIIKPARSQHSYPWYLEKGTRFMAKRPWLRPALSRNRRMLKRAITRGSLA